MLAAHINSYDFCRTYVILLLVGDEVDNQSVRSSTTKYCTRCSISTAELVAVNMSNQHGLGGSLRHDIPGTPVPVQRRQSA